MRIRQHVAFLLAAGLTILILKRLNRGLKQGDPVARRGATALVLRGMQEGYIVPDGRGGLKLK